MEDVNGADDSASSEAHLTKPSPQRKGENPSETVTLGMPLAKTNAECKQAKEQKEIHGEEGIRTQLTRTHIRTD